MKEQSALAANLKKFRKQTGLTQAAVANTLGIERSRYAHYENNTTPSAENLRKLALIFDITLDELMSPHSGENFMREKNPNIIFEDFMLNELRSDEKALVIKYRLLSEEAKDALIKQIEAKINKSEN